MHQTQTISTTRNVIITKCVRSHFLRHTISFPLLRSRVFLIFDICFSTEWQYQYVRYCSWFSNDAFIDFFLFLLLVFCSVDFHFYAISNAAQSCKLYWNCVRSRSRFGIYLSLTLHCHSLSAFISGSLRFNNAYRLIFTNVNWSCVEYPYYYCDFAIPLP